MRHFGIKAAVTAFLILVCLGISAKFVFGMKGVSFGSASAYEIASWLSKNGITVSKEIIDTDDLTVVAAQLTSLAADKDTAAAPIAGANIKKSAADTYIGENGTLSFSGMNFEFKAADDFGASFGADKYNAGKKAETLLKSLGINLSGSVITSFEQNGVYTAKVTKTIRSLPVFNDTITVKMTADKAVGISGIWYFAETQSQKRRAKTAADALLEYVKLCDGKETEIVSMEPGYVLETADSETASAKPVWRIIDSDGAVCDIDA